MSTTLKMVLSMSNEKSFTLSLPDPKEGLTRAEVSTCADEIIDKQVFLSSGATPEELTDAYIEEVRRIDLE